MQAYWSFPNRKQMKAIAPRILFLDSMDACMYAPILTVLMECGDHSSTEQNNSRPSFSTSHHCILVFLEVLVNFLLPFFSVFIHLVACLFLSLLSVFPYFRIFYYVSVSRIFCVQAALLFCCHILIALDILYPKSIWFWIIMLLLLEHLFCLLYFLVFS